MIPWMSEAKQYRTVLLHSIEQEEPHACTKSRRSESIERSCGVDVDGMGTGASWVCACHVVC